MTKRMKTSKRVTGDYGEDLAVRYLKRHFYRIVERNWFAGKKEIDIIAVRFGIIAFVEVKTRIYSDEDFENLPPPRKAVDRDKQCFTRQAASEYLRYHPTGKKPRMDVLEVSLAPSVHGKKPKVRKIHHLIGAY